MSKISINRITNANVYIDGENFLGRAEVVNLPQIKMKTAQHKSLGMIGTSEFPTGIDKIECKIKWASLYPEVLKKAANPFKSVKLQLRASLESYTSEGRGSEVPVVMHVNGSFKNFPMGTFKQNENAQFETTMSVFSAKMVVDGNDIFEIDTLTNVYKVEGEDALETYRANIGA